MPAEEREKLIKGIERIRGSRVICYLTTLRPNLPGQMAEDAVRHIFDHLFLFDTRPIPQLDIFLVSNGGSGTVPWRLISLFREFAKKVAVLIPYRAYSAASLLALGADEIVMHPFGELGPIDPTVSNEFNPTDAATKQRLGISVEDVRAYVSFVKETVGITHEDELVKALVALTDKVHPLALGNVERFISQSRLIARKMLMTHMKPEDTHVVDEIVENMASKLYFHGHPINRHEAKDDLKLKVKVDLSAELESAMWRLYKDFEMEFDNQSIFYAPGDLAALDVAGNPGGAGLPIQQVQAAAPLSIEKVYPNLLHVIVESTGLSCRFLTTRRYRLQKILTQQGLQALIQEDILSQAWSCSPATRGAAESQPPSS